MSVINKFATDFYPDRYFEFLGIFYEIWVQKYIDWNVSYIGFLWCHDTVFPPYIWQPFSYLFDTRIANPAHWADLFGQVLVCPQKSFGGISIPFDWQGEGADYAHHITTTPPPQIFGGYAAASSPLP